jgi:hypothetical protein
LRYSTTIFQTRNGGKRVENVFEEVFERLLKQLPAVRNMFTTRTFLSAMSSHGEDIASVRDHARIMVKMIDTIISNFDVHNNNKRSRNKTITHATLIDPLSIGMIIMMIVTSSNV